MSGYVMVDSGGGPGVSREEIIKAGLDPNKVFFAEAGKKFEADTMSCGHCQKIVAKSVTRVRSRGHCQKCSSYICDNCHANLFMTGLCDSAKARADRAREIAALFEQRYNVPINGTELLTSLKEQQHG